MTHDVFISYSTEDKQLANAICELLEKRDVSCWIAPKSVPPGARFDEAIVDAIDQSFAMVLILSANANRSDYVVGEVNRAFSKGKTIFTVRLEDVLPAKALQIYTARHQWTDAFPPPLDAHCARLASAILALTGKADRHNTASPQVGVATPCTEVQPHAPAQPNVTQATASHHAVESVIRQLVAERGLPSHQIEVSMSSTYYLYDTALVKVVSDWNGKNPTVLVFRRLPIGGAGTLAESDLPGIAGWPQPTGMIRLALLARKLMPGMRLEDIVLFAGAPKHVTHTSSVPSGSRWRIGGWEDSSLGTLLFEKSPTCFNDLTYSGT